MPDRLAIDGGTPVRAKPLAYGRHVVDEADVQAVAAVLRGDWLTTGPTVEAYERAFAAYVDGAHAVAVNSGTAALHAAAFLAGIQPEAEAIVPAITFAASANCVRYFGGRPVFADVEADTLLIDASSAAALVTPRTRAIIPVDFAGQPADLEAIHSLANRHALIVIEDAAHALGATYRGQRVGGNAQGEWAHFTAFSTHPVKHITTGEGGMILTENASWAEALRAFRSHGVHTDAHERARRGDWVYEMKFLGYNYRLPDILCALGLSQLAKLDGWLARRRALAARYAQALRELPEIEPLAIRDDRESAWHLYVVKLALDQFRVGRREVFRAMRAEGINVNVHYLPVYWHPYYQALGYKKGLCPVAEAQYERILTLPLWAGMSDADLDDVIKALHKVVSAYRA